MTECASCYEDVEEADTYVCTTCLSEVCGGCALFDEDEQDGSVVSYCPSCFEEVDL